MPSRVLWSRQRMRWTLGADDIMFTVKRHRLFFSLGKTVPIKRGDGVYQKPMNFSLEQIDQGQWVHIFPEGGSLLNVLFLSDDVSFIYLPGKINLTKELMRLKWGKFTAAFFCKQIEI